MALCFALRGRDAQKYHPITAGITAAGCPDAGDRGGARRRRGIYFKNVLYLRTILQGLFFGENPREESPDQFPRSFPLRVLSELKN